MVIDISGILKEFGGKIDIDGELDLNDGGVSFAAPIKIKGSVFNNGQSLTLKAECTGVLKTQCARCLKDIEADIKFPVSENLVRSDSPNASDDEEAVIFEGYTVELDEIVLNSFFLNSAMRYLCREDCKGLCPECGADLNEGECECNRDYIDPRWSALADIMNKE